MVPSVRAGRQPTGYGRRVGDPVLVSSCLAGVACRHDGRDRRDLAAADLPADAVPVCPEVLGGLGVPREPAEIVGGDGTDVWAGRARVLTVTGRDVTASYQAGARRALAQARAAGARRALLVEGSPSCGCRRIRDGTFAGKDRAGPGVTAALLAQAGIEVLPVGPPEPAAGAGNR
jgi:uncharacterized protein YbbK (DUF523 family)